MSGTMISWYRMWKRSAASFTVTLYSVYTLLTAFFLFAFGSAFFQAVSSVDENIVTAVTLVGWLFLFLFSVYITTIFHALRSHRVALAINGQSAYWRRHLNLAVTLGLYTTFYFYGIFYVDMFAINGVLTTPQLLLDLPVTWVIWVSSLWGVEMLFQGFIDEGKDLYRLWKSNHSFPKPKQILKEVQKGFLSYFELEEEKEEGCTPTACTDAFLLQRMEHYRNVRVFQPFADTIIQYFKRSLHDSHHTDASLAPFRRRLWELHDALDTYEAVEPMHRSFVELDIEALSVLLIDDFRQDKSWRNRVTMMQSHLYQDAY